MVLGVDFDNTIVCYDRLFHRVAVERGLVPADLAANKSQIRDYLRQRGQERVWTELQGYVYGPRMAEADPFPGVVDFFVRAVKTGLPLHIISHKTRTPAVGPAYDLHQAAWDWLKTHGFLEGGRVGLASSRVFFGVTRQEKIDLICKTGCTHFVDDLEELFLEMTFPQNVVKILFGRTTPPAELPDVKVAADWTEVTNYVFPTGA